MDDAGDRRVAELAGQLALFEPITLTGGFVVRALAADDGPALAGFVAANRQHLAHFLPAVVEEIVDLDAARVHCEHLLELQAKAEMFEVHVWRGDLLCGSIRLRDFDAVNRSANIGYFIAGDLQGRGLATRAVGAVLEWAFEVLQLHRIGLRCAAMNTASAALAHRLGFTLEGRLRDCELIDGVYSDDLAFSRLRTDRIGTTT